MTTTPISAIARVTSGPGSRRIADRAGEVDRVSLVGRSHENAVVIDTSVVPHELVDDRRRQRPLEVHPTPDRWTRVAVWDERHGRVHVRWFEQCKAPSPMVERTAPVLQGDDARRGSGAEHDDGAVARRRSIAIP